MNSLGRLQHLARIGSAMALGALGLGVLGMLIMAMDATQSFERLALVLLVPGALLLAAALYLIVAALRSPSERWQATFIRAAQVLTLTAGVSAVGVLVSAFVVAQGASTLQVVLISLVGAQGPAATYVAGRHLREAA